jgi:hypothetical protein
VNTLSVCPVEDIAAPLDKGWSLLVDPHKLDLWWDAKLQRVRPVSTMVPSQLIDAAPQGFFNKFHIGLAVKDVNHALRPSRRGGELGTMDEHHSVRPLRGTPGRTRVA